VDGRILVVDDEPDICAMIRDVLIDHFQHIETANSAAEALAKLDKEAFDLIFLDIMMPDMTGMDFLKKIRSQKKQTPVVFLSASDTEDNFAKALLYGASDFLTKPFENEQLIRLATKMAQVGQLQKK